MFVPCSKDDDTFLNETRDYFCPSVGEDTYLNDMATLMFNSPEVAIKQLFHQDGEIVIKIAQQTATVTCFTYRCVHPVHDVDSLPHLFLHCLLDTRCWNFCWHLSTLSTDWSNLWKDHQHAIRVKLIPPL